jgi:hypothetical protein
MKNLLFVCCISLAAIFAGCGRGGSDGVASQSVYVVVNGRPVTVEYVSNAVMVAARTMELAHRPVQKRNFARWANRMATARSRTFVSSEMIDQELVRRGVEPTAESDKSELEKYNGTLRGKYASVVELADAYGGLKPTFMDLFRKGSRLAAYMATKEELKISEEDIASHIEKTRSIIARSEAVNRRAKENGEKAYARLTAGEDWEAVAKDCSEDEEERGKFPWQEWETFRLQDFYLPEVSLALAGKTKGFVTRPLDTDQGLVIVKVVDEENGLFTCVRILFRMTDVPELPTHDDAEKTLKEERTRRIQQELYDESRERSSIEFPNGTNNVLTVWRE